jgi:uracil-DNA glycosylase
MANSPWEEGTPNRKICILAEAPARNEIRMNQPLVGLSGMLFNDCLHAANIVRAECYILNVFPYEVFKDKTDSKIFNREGDMLWSSRTGFTAFGLEEAKPTLKRLEKSQANVIVPLGGVALSLLFGDSRIMKWRGSILESKRLPGRKLVPTLHPAFSLRGNYTARYTIQADLKRVREESSTRQILLPKRELIIDPQFNEVIAFLNDMTRARRVATDIEILNHQISCLSFAPRADLSMCIPMLDEGNRHRWTEEQEAQIWLLIAKVMGDEKIEKINQNILFDVAFEFEQNSVFTRGTTHCTMCLQHILYPDFPKGLDYICSIRTREPYYKDDGKIWQKPWIDLDRFWTYNAKDSAVALEAFDDAYTEIEGYEWTYERTLALFRPLMFMMIKGIKVDRVRLKKTNEEIKKKIAETEKTLRETAEWDFNPGSPKQCQEYFYVTKGIKPYVSSKTGSITCDDKAMARIYKRYQLPEAKLVQEIRSLRKLHSSYLEVGIDSDDRIRCSYNPRGTSTGRLSSSETVRGTGMNLQSLHAEFKDFLVADDDD